MGTREKTSQRVFLAALLAGGLALSACGSEEAGSGSAADPASAAVDLAARGRAVYQSNCTACHNNDPTRDGAVGPALAGSSLALLEAKVIHNEYPPGYQPKRETGNMIPLPHLEPELRALHAYLTKPDLP